MGRLVGRFQLSFFTAVQTLIDEDLQISVFSAVGGSLKLQKFTWPTDKSVLHLRDKPLCFYQIGCAMLFRELHVYWQKRPSETTLISERPSDNSL